MWRRTCCSCWSRCLGGGGVHALTVIGWRFFSPGSTRCFRLAVVFLMWRSLDACNPCCLVLRCARLTLKLIGRGRITKQLELLAGWCASHDRARARSHAHTRQTSCRVAARGFSWHVFLQLFRPFFLLIGTMLCKTCHVLTCVAPRTLDDLHPTIQIFDSHLAEIKHVFLGVGCLRELRGSCGRCRRQLSC